MSNKDTLAGVMPEMREAWPKGSGRCLASFCRASIDKAKTCIVIKRGQGQGFSGIENALFYLDNTRLLYGDGQKAAAGLIAAIKAVD